MKNIGKDLSFHDHYGKLSMSFLDFKEVRETCDGYYIAPEHNKPMFINFSGIVVRILMQRYGKRKR